MTVQNNRVVVVGAGLMGQGIAHAFLVSNHDVTLVDVRPDALENATRTIHKIIGDGVALKKNSEEHAQQSLARLITRTDLAGAAVNADLLLETATESLQIKTQILREADPLLPEHAIVATNTSALSITEIAATLRNPERVIGMHFFNPVHKMKLVEIVLGLTTGAATLERTRAYVQAIGKTSIVVNEAPGLTTSRMSAMMGNEAMTMLQEGIASAEDIDTALRLGFNHPMGPLELGDLTGWDTRLAVLEYLHKTLGEKFRPCPLISKMVKAGFTGRKSGRGVYAYNEKGEKIPNSGLRASQL